MIIVTICGASGSGKTLLSNNICNELRKRGISCNIISLDAYYIHNADLSFDERTLINYDSPDAFDFSLLKTDIDLLVNNNSITKKRYDYSRHIRIDSSEQIKPTSVLIIEGIHSFADKTLLDKSDLRIFVDTDPDVCIVRRMCRDIKSRNRTVDKIADQYLSTVKPMFDKYIRLYRNDADICVVGGGNNIKAVNIAAVYISSIIK